MRFLSSTSTFTHSSAVKVGQTWWGSTFVYLSGLKIIFVFWISTLIDLNIRISLEKHVWGATVYYQSSYRLYSSISGYVAFKIQSPNFSIFKQALKGNYNSLPLITIFGKSNKWTSRGSSIPFLVRIICFGYSSGGRHLIRDATSSAVFHLANCPSLFYPVQTLVWITFK